jgi:hypothetical protein
MSVLLVAYDFRNPGQSYSEFYDNINNYLHIKLSETSYAIYTNQPTSYVYKKLVHSIDKKDNLYVIPLNRPWSGYGSYRNRDWLVSYL